MHKYILSIATQKQQPTNCAKHKFTKRKTQANEIAFASYL